MSGRTIASGSAPWPVDFRAPPLTAARRFANTTGAMLTGVLRVRAGTPTAGVLVALGLVAGCQSVTPERIAAWKTSDEGRERLMEALRDRSAPVPLRAQAATALVEVGWVDRVESAVGGLPFGDRAR